MIYWMRLAHHCAVCVLKLRRIVCFVMRESSRQQQTSKATIDVPINVALQYNQRLSRTPEVKAGASERAGFIDAPDINARKNI
jgi:hypothetical protein